MTKRKPESVMNSTSNASKLIYLIVQFATLYIFPAALLCMNTYCRNTIDMYNQTGHAKNDVKNFQKSDEYTTVFDKKKLIEI